MSRRQPQQRAQKNEPCIAAASPLSINQLMEQDMIRSVTAAPLRRQLEQHAHLQTTLQSVAEIF